MAEELSAPPVLSTPDDHILEIPTVTATSTISDDALRITYEIARTVTEIHIGAWSRIALQFPDHMLVDAPRVVEALTSELAITSDGSTVPPPRICVLADTSYSACCVDEIAAEHADAEVVVHYGRTCLSPTSRIPAIFVYTTQDLDFEATIRQFEEDFDKNARVVVMADLTYQSHVAAVCEELKKKGFSNIVATEVARDPGAIIPNRGITQGDLSEENLKEFAVFHIADPPTSLLLALQSRFASLHVLSAPSSTSRSLENPTLRTAGLLRRRFAKVLALASAGVIGILVNTLSVSNYMSSIDVLKRKIAAADKKAYTVVVGKLNPAKLANFAEIEGWVIVGCWESGLIEDDAGYWRPVVTPFEMEIALLNEEERTWGGEWWGGIEKLSLEENGDAQRQASVPEDNPATGDDLDGGVEGEESQPPEFDLRTGKLVSHSRPMRLPTRSKTNSNSETTTEERAAPDSAAALIKRTVGELASINGVASPGAEFLRANRTWQGLGTDFDENNEQSTVVEEGRSGVARGYHVGEDETRH